MENSVHQQTEVRQNSVQISAYLIAILACVVFAFAFGFSMDRYSDSAQIEFQSRINPNTAAIESLIRLPGIGESLSDAIAAYRDQWARENSTPAFIVAGDLQKVSGIGPKKVEAVSGYLKFEQEN
jgi:competence ComEA-like helix-hairpin-helix protein